MTCKEMLLNTFVYSFEEECGGKLNEHYTPHNIKTLYISNLLVAAQGWSRNIPMVYNATNHITNPVCHFFTPQMNREFYADLFDFMYKPNRLTKSRISNCTDVIIVLGGRFGLPFKSIDDFALASGYLNLQQFAKDNENFNCPNLIAISGELVMYDIQQIYVDGVHNYLKSLYADAYNGMHPIYTMDRQHNITGRFAKLSERPTGWRSFGATPEEWAQPIIQTACLGFWQAFDSYGLQHSIIWSVSDAFLPFAPTRFVTNSRYFPVDDQLWWEYTSKTVACLKLLDTLIYNKQRSEKAKLRH